MSEFIPDNSVSAQKEPISTCFQCMVRNHITRGRFTRDGNYIKWCFAVAVIASTSWLNAIGQMKSDGTIIVIISSEDEVVVAADSRTAFEQSYSDENCKILTLGRDVVFAASGRRGQRNKITHVYSWDADTLARNAFRSAAKKGTPQRIADQLASSWGVAMKKQLEEDIASNKAIATANIEKDGTMALGVFIDFEKDGTRLIVVEKLAYSDVDGTVKAFVDHRATSPEPHPYYLGKGDIIREIDAHTPRSKEWKRDADMRMDFSTDPNVFMAKKLVQLTIENYPATRLDENGKAFSVVGGKIAVAKLTRNGFDWVDPGTCLQSPPKARTKKEITKQHQ